MAENKISVQIRGKQYSSRPLDSLSRTEAKDLRQIQERGAEGDVTAAWDVLDVLMPKTLGKLIDSLTLGECNATFEQIQKSSQVTAGESSASTNS
jgi:hypothetical protein